MKGYLTTSIVLMVACSGDKSLTVQNPAPTADIISHDDGSEILEGFTITLEGVVSDSNHTPDQLTTRWVINGEVVCEDIIPDEDGSTFCETVLDTDETEISLEVRDAEQKFGSDTINVVIVETEAPIAEIITPIADGVYYSDQLITFEGLVSDAEDDPELLVAYWESNVDGVLSDVDGEVSTSGEVLGYGTLSEGQHAIELHVEDTMQKSSTESVVITVGPPNSAPLCEILTPEDGAAGSEGELVAFEGTASDVDVASDWLAVVWTSDKDGEIGTSTPNSDGTIGFPYSNLSVDTHNITMTVTDEVGATCTDSIYYTVGTAPSITIDAPTDGDIINEGTPITFSATVSDSQDQPDVIDLDWVVDGNSISTQGATSSGEATFSDSSLTFGTYNLVVTATDTDGLTDSDQINFTVNGLPSAPVISINPDPATTSDGLSVSIDSPSVDPEGTIPTYTYDWQLGGQTQTAYTTSSLPSSATNKGEQWTVIVTPNDGITDGTSASASITIANTAPTLGGLSITPTGTTYNDDTLTCAATITDPDESPVPTFEWTVGGNVIGSSATLDLSTTGVMPNDVVTCTVSVVDSDGATAIDTITQTVSNRAPTLANTAITPNSGITTETALTCATTVSDDDGESLTPTYTWTVGANTYTGGALQLDSTMVNPGDTITCTADVVDGYGGSATDTVSVSADNTNPVISDVSITYSGDLTSVTLLTCEYTATDADNQALTPTYTWTNLSTNTPFLSTADTLQLSPSDTSPNDVVECSVTVTDTSGGTDTVAATDTVLNTDPTFSSNAMISTTGTQVGDTWTCSATGTDQDDGTLTPTYEWTDANGNVIGSGDTLVLSATNATPTEDITCIATIIDSLNVAVTSSASETVTNTTPVFDVSASITPNTGVTTASSLQCSGTASDSDGDTPTLTYVWTNSSGITYASTSDTLQLDASTVLPSDVVSCTITATDDQGDTVSSSASVTVDNTLPNITSSITTNGTTNTGELTCSAISSDVDDSTTPTITYEWFNTNGSLGTANPLQLDPTMGVDGDTIDCTATATDLSGGTSSDTATHTITNTPPVIDSVALSPSTIDVNTSTVTCVVSSSDADGDTVTESFEWYVDGNLQSETTNMYSGPFIVGTLLACRTTPNDGKTDGDFAEDTATIQNTLPAVDSVTLSPSTVYTNDTITATAVLSDVDSSHSGSLTANYEWFVDNVSVQNGSSNTLDGVSMFNRDQSVYVMVTPNDGVEDGIPLNSGSIVVSNTAPVMSSVTVSPDPASAGSDDLTCDAVATDMDGDSVVYTYVWTDDSGIVQQTTIDTASVSDVYLASGTSEGTWTCDVTPYDGTDYGLGSSSLVNVVISVPNECTSINHNGYTYWFCLSGLDYVPASAFCANYGMDLLYIEDAVENNWIMNTAWSVSDEPWWIGYSDRISEGNWFWEAGNVSSYVNWQSSCWHTSPDNYAGDENCASFDHSASCQGYGWNDCPCSNRNLPHICKSLDLTDADGDGYAAWEDCDDNDASVYDDCCYFGTCDWNTDLSSGIGIDWVDLSAGTSVDGSYSLSNDFSMMTTEVTQDMYETVIGNNPSHYVGGSQPVETLTWFEAAAFANALSTLEGLPSCYAASNSYLESGDYTGSSFYDCPGYRLPTEAEWQYSAQAGQNTTYAGGNTIDDVGWYNLNSGGSPQDVAQKLANAWNIFDMSGNVNEWTHDRYGSFPNSSVDPIYSPNGSSDIAVRGGFWGANSSYHTPTYITAYAPGNLNNGHHGFRLVKTMPVDVDGDGVAAWEDCDDNDAAIWDSDGSSSTCAATSCKTILDDGYSIGDGTYWIDPDGSGAFEAYCDMTTDGGGWTLLFHGDTSFDQTILGSSGSYYSSFGTSAAYDSLVLGTDVILDNSTSMIIGSGYDQRTIITGIHPSTQGQTLYSIFNGSTPRYLEAEDNSNVVTLFNNGSCSSISNDNWGSLTCSTSVLTLYDPDSSCDSYIYLIGASASHSSPWTQCAGWPQDITGVHYPEVIRFWTR